jgi:hypothetical protein
MRGVSRGKAVHSARPKSPKSPKTMNTPSITLVSSLAAGLLMAASVSANEPHKGQRDGAERPASISRDAFVEKSGARFDKVDTDADGLITQAEVDAAMADKSERWARMGKHLFARMDVNDEGQVSRDAALTLAAAQFDAMDTDGNGELSRKEMKAHHAAMKARRAEERAEGDAGDEG